MTRRRSLTSDELEDMLAQQLVGIGLPEPERQFYYAKPRRFRSDLAYPEARLLIEVIGGVYDHRAHGSITGILADRDRLNHATMHGYRMLRFTSDQIDDSAEAVNLIEKVLKP